ncbi:MAG: aspartyl-tRNA amidotransferase [Deltaproteobacteria bacterium]|nr:aspartyl-tRNA amidotransferase [Deltaproteobacteria bacterium]
MSIEATVTDAMKAAMKAREKARLQALRNIRAGFLLARKETGADALSDAEAIAVLKRSAKRLKDSIQAYEEGGRADLVEQESAELAVVEAFLPAGPSEDAVRAWVAAAIASTGATSPREMGKVMGAVMKDHRGEVDGNVVRKLVLAALQG